MSVFFFAIWLSECLEKYKGNSDKRKSKKPSSQITGRVYSGCFKLLFLTPICSGTRHIYLLFELI